MLVITPTPSRRTSGPAPAGQRGIVLMLAIVVLIIMSLAAVGLMRSLLSSNKVAGNLAFQQSALQSADVGIERAIAWLEQNNFNNKLDENTAIGVGVLGYMAQRQDPAPGVNWEQQWNQRRIAGDPINTLPVDAAGNQVSFMIHRLCNAGGPASSAIGCQVHPFPAPAGGSKGGGGSGGVIASVPDFFYYRITARVQGPRNTVGFAQAVVAL